MRRTRSPPRPARVRPASRSVSGLRSRRPRPRCSSRRRPCRPPAAVGRGRRRARRPRRRARVGRGAVLAADRPVPGQRGAEADRGVGVARCRSPYRSAASRLSRSAVQPARATPAGRGRRRCGSASSARARKCARVRGAASASTAPASASRSMPYSRMVSSIRYRGRGARRRLQQRLVGQRGQQVEHVLGARPAPAQTGSAASAVDAAREHREPLGQRRAPPSVEQVPAPVDDRAQRLVPRQRGPAAAGEQPEPVVEPGGDSVDRQRPQPGGGQLDRQRHAVEPAADLHDRRDVAASTAKPGRTAAARSANSRTAGCRSAVDRGRVGRRQRQRRDRRRAPRR